MLRLVFAESSVVAAVTTSSEGTSTMKSFNNSHFLKLRRFERKLPPSIEYVICKNMNWSRINAAHESLLPTACRRRTGSTQQHPGDSVDSHSIMISSLHDVMLFISEPSSRSRLNETLITGSDRMMLLPREDVLLLSSESFFQISLRTSTLKKMRKKIHGAFVLFFLFLFKIIFL